MPQPRLTEDFQNPGFYYLATIAVYFEKHLVAAHSKCWTKYAFSLFFKQKAEKINKNQENGCKIRQKVLVEIAPECWPRVLFPENTLLKYL